MNLGITVIAAEGMINSEPISVGAYCFFSYTNFNKEKSQTKLFTFNISGSFKYIVQIEIRGIRTGGYKCSDSILLAKYGSNGYDGEYFWWSDETLQYT